MKEAREFRLVFLEGHYSEKDSTPLDPQWLTLTPIEGGGLRLSIEKTLSTPIYLIHRCEGIAAAQSQLQVHIASGVHVSLCERFMPMPAATGGWRGTTEITLAKAAHCEYLHLQEPVAGAWEHDVSVYQEADSVWEAHTFLTGAGSHRADFHMEQAGTHANATLLGAFLGHDTQSVNVSSTVVHGVPETRSRQLVKGIAADQSRCSFHGMVHVKPHAKNAYGKMHNHNLLLDSTAEVQTMPCFQIEHDQVVCNHGATVGQLRTDELFYLQARGILPARAEQLLSRAFIEEPAAEILQRPEVGPAITAYIDAFFTGRAAIKGNTP